MSKEEDYIRLKPGGFRSLQKEVIFIKKYEFGRNKYIPKGTMGKIIDYFVSTPFNYLPYGVTAYKVRLKDGSVHIVWEEYIECTHVVLINGGYRSVTNPLLSIKGTKKA